MATALAQGDILIEKQRRLRQLERRAARQGYDTPPEVTNEIDDLRAEVMAAAPASIGESHTILYNLLMETRADVRRLYVLIPVLLLLFVIAVRL